MSCIYCSQGQLHPLACNTAALVVPFVSGLRRLAAPEHPEFNTMTPLYVLCCDLSLDSSLFGLGAFRSGMLLCPQPVHLPQGLTRCTAECFYLHKFSKVSEWPDLMDCLPEVGG